jgi:hypothetical protein
MPVRAWPSREDALDVERQELVATDSLGGTIVSVSRDEVLITATELAPAP